MLRGLLIASLGLVTLSNAALDAHGGPFRWRRSRAHCCECQCQNGRTNGAGTKADEEKLLTIVNRRPITATAQNIDTALYTALFELKDVSVRLYKRGSRYSMGVVATQVNSGYFKHDYRDYRHGTTYIQLLTASGGLVGAPIVLSTVTLCPHSCDDGEIAITLEQPISMLLYSDAAKARFLFEFAPNVGQYIRCR